MGNVVTELAKLDILRADVGIEGWANSGDLKIVPVTVSVRASSAVVSDDVVRVGDPNGGGGLVSVEQTP